jgi:hypothetical protein
MPVGTSARLLHIADREFRELANKPLTIEPGRKFKPVKLASRMIRSAQPISARRRR